MGTPVTFRQDLEQIEYPTGDGEPMAETATHRDLMIYAITALKTHFAYRDDVWISGNDFVYFVEGDPNRRVSPDTYVVFDVGNGIRDCYKAWDEGGKMPDVVIEFTSKTTRNEDTGKKRTLYEQTLRVTEHFLFDPTGDYLNPILQGYRLVGDRYERLPLQNDRLISEQLGLELVLEAGMLRFIHPLTRWRYLTPNEEHDRAEAERNRAEIEHNRAETERNRAETERSRAETEHNRAEAAHNRADAAHNWAEREAEARAQAEERTRQAEEELTRLRAELERPRDRL